MSTNVNKIVENAVTQVRSILVQAVEQVDESARADLIAKFNQSVGGEGITTIKANPRTTKKTTKKVAAKTTKKAVKAKAKAKTDKPKRVVSEATRKKLAANLAKARKAKADKTKGTAPKKAGRTKKKK